jgi:hypothetical protein
MIQKDSEPIDSLGDWERLGGPKHATQWVPERSAFEVAREWLDVSSPELPPGILALLRSNEAFGDVLSWQAEPEAQIRFDKYPGEPRNCDLLVKATDVFGDFIIAVEAKADESFGETVEDTLSAALERRIANSSSRGLERIASLSRLLFSVRGKRQARVGALRYQLLTATAGALSAATSGARTVLLVEEFKTGKTTAEKHEANQKDLDAFVHRLTNGATGECKAGRLHGPITLPEPLRGEPAGPQLFVGKIQHDRTQITADEAVRTALRALGGQGTIDDVSTWISRSLTQSWKDIGTTMADMTASKNSQSGYPSDRQILERVESGLYRLNPRSTTSRITRS